jgi:hypothetical protein
VDLDRGEPAVRWQLQRIAGRSSPLRANDVTGRQVC